MALKLKLPERLTRRLGGGTSAPAVGTGGLGAPVPGGAPPGAAQSGALPIPTRRKKITLSQLKRGAAWAAGLFFVFLVFAWVNMPTKAIAWRISQEAKKGGMVVDIDDVWISPLGRVTLYDVTWSFPPARVDEASVPFVAERVDVRVAPLRALFGNIHATFNANLDEGAIEGSFDRNGSETAAHLELQEVPLYALPKFQQSLGAPVRGYFDMTVDLVAPENRFEDSTGTIEIRCMSCTMGDGQSKLYVPGAKERSMLAKGMTVPEIDFGELHGTFAIANGVATAEEFVSVSDDITISVSGDIRLHDPFVDSEFGMIIKVFVSDQLQEKSTEIKLMVATSGKTQKLKDEDLIEGQSAGLGYKLMGTIRRPKLKGIYSKSRAQRLREARERRARAEERSRKRAADRKKKQAERSKREAEAKAAAAANAAEETPEDDADDDDTDDGGNAPEPRLGTAAISARVGSAGIAEAGAGEPEPAPQDADGDGNQDGDADGDADGDGNQDGDADGDGNQDGNQDGDADGDGNQDGDGDGDADGDGNQDGDDDSGDGDESGDDGEVE